MLKNKDEIAGNEELSANDNSEVVESKTVDFSVGQDIEVIPTGFKEYGVFCDCGNGFSGLVHISRITPNFVKNVSDYFTVGKPFTAKIIEVHNDKKQLSLSTKEFDIKVKTGEYSNDKQSGFKGLENNLNSWVKKDSNK